MKGWGSDVNDATGRDWRYDPPSANRSRSTRMELWRGTAEDEELLTRLTRDVEVALFEVERR